MCTGTHDFIPLPETARVQMVYTMQGTIAENVFYFFKTDGWTSATLLDLGNSVFSAWGAFIQGQQPTVLTLIRIMCQDMSEPEGAYAEVAPTGANQGSTETEPLPLGSTLAIKFATGLAGRSNRGRLYHIGLGEGVVNGNFTTDGYAATLAEKYANFFDAIEADFVDVDHVVASYCNEKAWRTVGVTNAVTAYSADNAIDSQRRRLAGRGM